MFFVFPHRHLRHSAITIIVHNMDIPRTANQSEKKTGNVYIYVDVPNFWAQGQQTYTQKYQQGTNQIPRWRFNHDILKDILLEKSSLDTNEATFEPELNLYGTKPRSVDSASVTSEIIVDLVDKVADAYYNSIPAVFIVVTGNRKVRSAVAKIAARGFPVHIWFWKNGMAKELIREDTDIDQDLVKTHYLDPYLEVISAND
ncbi:hypothetical protein GGTG_13343 [Gaeumannomyces tritici R3-111a-1]|uniref:NYN domain-containing protein n=1 Tax=Gaeumannomyces tritici (strain R3-111a-1) TaxID=644352 RepID=J3PIL4_GAET3|nr:hypothetical protein GGTG_13343 [Gaeumannomyces tritici R3-111a-1]EJT69075.1 hypothetical protein GGTG_13343 [Gaeumannomyces tritici R3-111a-1]